MQLISEIWNTVIIEPMINSLVILYSLFFNNFGLSIIIFTIIIRGIMIPLTVKQSRQIREMTLLQPKLKELQQKYGKDRQKISQETMRLYKEHGVNTLGCLGPMFIQFPIWIGLYQALIKTLPSTPEKLIDLSGYLYYWMPKVNEIIPINSGFFWLDLAQPDRTPLLPILVGVSMWMMQKMTTIPSADPKQQSTNQMMLWMMPVMFGFFTISFPSGLALYWIISNIAGIVIQGFVTGWAPLSSIRTKPVPPQTTDNYENILKEDQSITDSTGEENNGEKDRNESKNKRRSNRNSTDRTRRKSRRSNNRNN